MVKAKAELETVIPAESTIIEEQMEKNEKLEKECSDVKISIPKTSAGDKTIIKGIEANDAFQKKKMIDQAQVLVCID